MKRVAIIGGGIAGLSAAYYLEKAKQNGAGLEWVLFEKSERLGGVIRTEYREGCVLEAGPDSFLTAKPDAAQLCRELGLGGQIIQSNDYQRKTYILAKGKLVVMPDGLMFMVPTKILPTVFSPLFSMRTKVRMAAEWFHPRRKQPDDETVHRRDDLAFGQGGGEATHRHVEAADEHDAGEGADRLPGVEQGRLAGHIAHHRDAAEERQPGEHIKQQRAGKLGQHNLGVTDRRRGADASAPLSHGGPEGAHRGRRVRRF